MIPLGSTSCFMPFWILPYDDAALCCAAVTSGNSLLSFGSAVYPTFRTRLRRSLSPFQLSPTLNPGLTLGLRGSNIPHGKSTWLYFSSPHPQGNRINHHHIAIVRSTTFVLCIASHDASRLMRFPPPSSCQSNTYPSPYGPTTIQQAITTSGLYRSPPECFVHRSSVSPGYQQAFASPTIRSGERWIYTEDKANPAGSRHRHHQR